MDLDIWDQDLESLQRQVESIENSLYDRSSNPKGILAVPLAVNQKLSKTFTVLVHHLRSVHKSTSERYRSLFALSYWILELGQLAESLCRAYDSLYKHRMWSHLFARRLGLNLLVKQDSLSSFAEQYSKLLSQRDYYKARMSDHESEISKLEREKSNLAIETENFLAGHSLQLCFGDNQERSIRHPVYPLLNKIFWGAFLAVNSDPVEVLRYKSNYLDLSKRSNDLLGQCRALMEARDRFRAVSYDPKLVRVIRCSIADLRERQSKLNELTDQMTCGLQKNSLILLQKKTSKSKT